MFLPLVYLPAIDYGVAVTGFYDRELLVVQRIGAAATSAGQSGQSLTARPRRPDVESHDRTCNPLAKGGVEGLLPVRRLSTGLRRKAC